MSCIQRSRCTSGPSTPYRGLWARGTAAALLASKSTYLRHEWGGQGLIARTNVLDCGVCSCLGPVQTLFISTFVGSHTHNTHARLWFNQRQRPAIPHSLSSKIHKGKVLNDFLSLPVFTACCPHPPCLLPVRQRKSGGIMAEVAVGSQCLYVCVWVCECVWEACAHTVRCFPVYGNSSGTWALNRRDEWTVRFPVWC